MGRQFNQSSSDKDRVYLPSAEFVESTPVINKFDAEQGDGSYFDLSLPSAGVLNYYDSSDVLQWTVLDTDLMTGPTNFLTGGGMCVDGTTLYVVAYDSSPMNMQLASVDIPTGNVTIASTLGAYTLAGIYLGVIKSEKVGNAIQYQGEYSFSIDITTGVIDETPLRADNQFIIGSVDNESGYALVHSNGGQMSLPCQVTPTNGWTTPLVPVFFGTKFYLYDAQTDQSVVVGPTEWEEETTKFVKANAGTYLDWEHV